MSDIFSCDILNSFKMSSQIFKYQASEATAAVNAKIIEKDIKKKHYNKSSKYYILYAACN